MSKNIFDVLSEKYDKLQAEKIDIEEKMDQVEVLKLLVNCNEHLYVKNDIPSGDFFLDSSVLNDKTTFDKLISLIPEENRIFALEESKGWRKDKEWIKQFNYYYILLDEKTLMELSLIIETETGVQPYYICTVSTRRGISPLTISDVKYGNANCFMVKDNDTSHFRIHNGGIIRNFNKEPLTNVLPIINLGDTFISKLVESLDLDVDIQRKK